MNYFFVSIGSWTLYFFCGKIKYTLFFRIHRLVDSYLFYKKTKNHCTFSYPSARGPSIYLFLFFYFSVSVWKSIFHTDCLNQVLAEICNASITINGVVKHMTLAHQNKFAARENYTLSNGFIKTTFFEMFIHVHSLWCHYSEKRI